MGLDVGGIGMGLDLGLDLKLFAARSLGRLATATAEEKEEEAMDACIRSLEEERGKIEMFKRELPLCVRLLADVIEVMKEEAEKKRVDRDEEAKMEDGDKRKWMSTAQLWVDNRRDNCGVADSEKRAKERTLPVSKANSGSFLPFKAVGNGAPSFLAPCYRRENPVLSSPAIKSSPQLNPAAATDECQIVKSSFAGATKAAEPSSGPVLSLQPQTHLQQQQARKARRCWSPELHQQFVAALHQLGGPQVATPKQIREVMKVDGLTNDEVKSHLQKYRLHNRRAHGSAVNQQIVLVGGLWVPQEQSNSQSGSPQAPLQFSGSSVAVSAATTGDSCEEDDKSESYGRK